MVYLSEYFKVFSKGQKAETAERRISKVARITKEIEDLKYGLKIKIDLKGYKLKTKQKKLWIMNLMMWWKDLEN